jgi:hypothetical protein
MSGKLVLIPCRLDRRDAKSALIEDAEGFPRKVVGPLGRVDGRLVVAARWLREANGRHRVRLDCGTELWVVYGPIDPKGFVPLALPSAMRSAPAGAGQ